MQSKLIAVIAEEDLVTGFTLAGVHDQSEDNVFTVTSKTSVVDLEKTFQRLSDKENIAVLIISSSSANMIRELVSSYNKPSPIIVEIPSRRS
ncbi:hypothetical protein RCL1_005930 [Eukaryota sp. TZLM3-RCL]